MRMTPGVNPHVYLNTHTVSMHTHACTPHMQTCIHTLVIKWRKGERIDRCITAQTGSSPPHSCVLFPPSSVAVSSQGINPELTPHLEMPSKSRNAELPEQSLLPPLPQLGNSIDGLKASDKCTQSSLASSRLEKLASFQRCWP